MAMKVLCLVTDAFGGDGGIAQYNRDLLMALATIDDVECVSVLSRHRQGTGDRLPGKIVLLPSARGRLAYSIRAIRAAWASRPDVVFCGHLFMLPLAWLVARLGSARLWLQAHGIEAWAVPGRAMRRGASRCNLVTCVSRHTRDRMLGGWLDVDPWRVRVLPNTVSEAFTPGPTPAALRERYALGNSKTILTVSRISPAERYKGHDRVIRILPDLLRKGVDVTYLVAGEGDDISRLMQVAMDAGVRERVRFIGRIPADELPDHYRLADVFVMPSTEEGFGIVFLEAVACGTPVVGGRRDGSWDALREGRLGFAVDPDNTEELGGAILAALAGGAGDAPLAAGVFRRANFTAHVHGIVADLMGNAAVNPAC